MTIRRARGAVVAVAASVLGSSVGGAFTPVVAHAATIYQYPVPTPSGEPNRIAPGPDGALWFTEDYGNRIGRITTAGVISEFRVPTPGSSPGTITTGPDANLWFTETLGNQVVRMTLSGTMTEFPISRTGCQPFGCEPFWIIAGPDGNLWFTELWGSKGIGRINTSGTVTEFALPIPNSAPEGLTIGPDGNLWFTEAMADKIGRITLTGGITEFPLPSTGSFPNAIATGRDGRLWFTEASGNRIGAMTTSGAFTEYPVPTLFSAPGGIAAGPDGNLWFVESGNSGKIGRITTGGRIAEWHPSGANLPGIQGITLGPDGNLWFTEYLANQIGTMVIATPRAAVSLPFADSFESGSFSPAAYDRQSCLPFESSLAHTGSLAIEGIQPSSCGAGGRLGGTAARLHLAAAHYRLDGKIWFYVKSQGANTITLLEYLRIDSNATAKLGKVYLTASGRIGVRDSNCTGPPGCATFVSKATAAPNRWHLVQFIMRNDHRARTVSVRAWLDGVQVVAGTDASLYSNPVDYNGVYVGNPTTLGAPSYDIVLDDFTLTS